MTWMQGTDFSVWQDDNSTPQMIDFNKMKQHAGFGFAKVSQSTWQDPDYVMNWSNSKYHEFKRDGYHFIDWNTTGLAQAKFFWGILWKSPGDIRPVGDYEKRTGNKGRIHSLATLKSFMEYVSDKAGEAAILYTSPGFWAEFGSDDPYWAQYPLWIANYEVTKPKVPAPWTTWDFWQYTSKGDGLKYGAESKSIDLNWCQFPEKYGLFPTPTLEQRVATLEAEVAELRRQVAALKIAV